MNRYPPGSSRMRILLAACAVTAFASCSHTGLPFGPTGARNDTGDAPAQIEATGLAERDIEAPDIFQVTEAGLWDGRPSLGGVWVAHPAAQDPERVIIRNEENGRSVIGALFRRDQGNPGPAMMISADAAAALNILAGDPTSVQVTALRRDPQSDQAPPPAAPVTSPTPGDQTAAAALSRAEIVAGIASAGPAAQALPFRATRDGGPAGEAVGRAYLQVGIFSTQENAASAAATLREAGLVPTMIYQTFNGRRVWRVIAGPAVTATEQDALLRTVRGLDFADAFALDG